MCNYDDKNFEKEVKNNHIIHWNYRNFKFFPKLLNFFGKHVTDLYLKGNYICTIPKWISEMENLSEIYLTSNKLTELPEGISELRFLSVLDVSDNQITELPKSLTSLTGLIHLNASRNLLRKLPDDIGRLKALSYLYVSHNKVSKIPCSITGCSSLSEIDLDYNNLTSVPKSMVYMPNLDIMCLIKNKLFFLPAYLPVVIPFSTRVLVPAYLPDAIPFSTRILAQGNENLTHISHQVEYLNNCRSGPYVKLNESVNENERKNFNGLVNEFSSDYSIICTEKNSHLVIPMQVYHENDTPVPTLQELCLRDADQLIFGFTNSRHTRRTESQKLRSQLPSCICSEFENGPTARCESCNISLFKFAFIRILWDEKRPKLNIVQYFCTNKCLRSFKMMPTAWPEIKWRRYSPVK